jgi:hypothetical protein
VARNPRSKEDIRYDLIHEVCRNHDDPTNDAMMHALAVFLIVRRSPMNELTSTETVPTTVLGLVYNFRGSLSSARSSSKLGPSTNHRELIHSHKILVSQQINGMKLARSLLSTGTTLSTLTFSPTMKY